MLIDIRGTETGPERDAAESLRRILSPVNSPGNLLLIVGAKCIGEDVQDIDLLMLGSFGRGLSFTGRQGASRHQEIRLVNLCLALEVKDHSSGLVKFESQRVWVTYRDGRRDATEQVQRQCLSLKRYLERNGLSPPRIEGALWLRNYEGDIPTAASNVLGSNPSALEFFALIERIRAPKKDEDNDNWFIAFSTNQKVDRVRAAANFFTQKVTPTTLDRRRLEKICTKLVSDQKYVERLGQQLLVFKGRGGSGKTIHLLRLAKDLYDTGKRVLFLTFNTALVSDIKRVLSIIGIQGQGFDDRGISISTANKYFGDVLKKFEMYESSAPGTPYDEKSYEKAKSQLIEYLSDDTPATIAKDPTVFDNQDIFSWDYVLIDEGQDWPENERDLLYKFFGPTRCIVADGVDQLTRSQAVCDWTRNVSGVPKQTVPLKRAMRMKSNLCRFIRDFAEEAGGEWDQEVNDELPGGLVTIIHGEYSRECHDRIFAQHKGHGNEPVDALFCVPATSPSSTSIAQRLRDWEFVVWDGTSRGVRGLSIPTNTQEHRVVHYESCRGLEGWTVVCQSLNRFFDQKRYYASTHTTELFDTPEQAKHRAAIAWTMIPLTRAVDHLVIHLDGDNAITDICRTLAERHPDFVTWETVR